MAKRAAKKEGGGVTSTPTKSKPMYRDIQMRSKWEATYAKYLDGLLAGGLIKAWAYEPERFVLGSRCSYLPDFRITTNEWELVYVEVKGYNRQAGMIKWKTAANMNQHAMFIMVRLLRHKPIIMHVAPHREMSVEPALFGEIK